MNIDFKTIIKAIRPGELLPLIPDNTLSGIKCEDHLTWVVDPKDREAFVAFWKEYLETELLTDSWITQKYPAEHIALKPADTVNIVGCEGMIGLSVPMEGDSVLTETLNRYGTTTPFIWGGVELTVPGVPQHVAYATDPSISIEEARAQIESLGYTFFTPVITHQDEGGSVEQCFFGTNKPFGPFAELVRRAGNPRQAFAARSIDFLYEHYNAHSRSL